MDIAERLRGMIFYLLPVAEDIRAEGRRERIIIIIIIMIYDNLNPAFVPPCCLAARLCLTLTHDGTHRCFYRGGIQENENDLFVGNQAATQPGVTTPSTFLSSEG